MHGRAALRRAVEELGHGEARARDSVVEIQPLVLAVVGAAQRRRVGLVERRLEVADGEGSALRVALHEQHLDRVVDAVRAEAKGRHARFRAPVRGDLLCNQHVLVKRRRGGQVGHKVRHRRRVEHTARRGTKVSSGRRGSVAKGVARICRGRDAGGARSECRLVERVREDLDDRAGRGALREGDRSETSTERVGPEPQEVGLFVLEVGAHVFPQVARVQLHVHVHERVPLLKTAIGLAEGGLDLGDTLAIARAPIPRVDVVQAEALGERADAGQVVCRQQLDPANGPALALARRQLVRLRKTVRSERVRDAVDGRPAEFFQDVPGHRDGASGVAAPGRQRDGQRPERLDGGVDVARRVRVLDDAVGRRASRLAARTGPRKERRVVFGGARLPRDRDRARDGEAGRGRGRRARRSSPQLRG